MQRWKATHEVRCKAKWSGRWRRARLMFVDGVFYSRDEWRAGANADWTLCADGTVVWRGAPPYWASEYTVKRIGLRRVKP